LLEYLALGLLIVMTTFIIYLVIRKAYRDVAAVAREHSLDMRTAAFVLAIRRVAKAALSRTALRAEVPELRA